MNVLRLKLFQLRIVSAIVWANARLQIAGALYIALPTPKRYAKFEYRSARVVQTVRKYSNDRAAQLSPDEKRWAEFIERQMRVMGEN
jgi:hypothetical protein